MNRHYRTLPWRILLLCGHVWSIAPTEVPIADNSFESTGSTASWTGLTRSTARVQGPPDGTAFASASQSSSPITQTLSTTIEAGQNYTLRVWARSITPAGSSTTSTAQAKLTAQGTVLATETIDVSPPMLTGVAATTESDDGANVWFEGAYRVHALPLMYQSISSNPITDPWLDPSTDLLTDAMAAGPYIDSAGDVSIYGTFYLTDAPTPTTSRLEKITLTGAVPNYQ